MNKRMQKSITVVRAIVLVALIFALYPIVLWILIFQINPQLSQEKKREIFNDYLPSFLNQGHTVAYVVFFLSVIALVFSLIWMNKETMGEKGFAITIFILTILQTLLAFFQLM